MATILRIFQKFSTEPVVKQNIFKIDLYILS